VSFSVRPAQSYERRFYLNPDKGQFFHCGLLGYASSFSAIGSGPGARALAILLSERGTWRNDQIAVVGDTAEAFDDVLRNALDIEVEVELMLLEIDGRAWVEELLEKSIVAFRTMCAFAVHLRHPKVIRMLATSSALEGGNGNTRMS
jgi:hypothetical protein